MSAPPAGTPGGSADSEGALYRGLGATLLRSVPVNTVYLPTVVFINEMLHRDEAP